MHDVIIIGGGPAGLVAAAWCGELGLKYLLVESSVALGGQLGWIHSDITNYPGIPSTTAVDLCDSLVKKLGPDSSVRLGANIERVSFDPISIEIADGEKLEAKSLIIATGVRRRELEVPGERELSGKGILESGSKDPKAVAGHNGVIVGGGDAALENAVILSHHAAKIYVVHRGAAFSARPQFLDAARSAGNVEFLTESIVEAFVGGDELTAVSVRDIRNGAIKEISATRGLVRIGVSPNSELFRDVVDVDAKGYIDIDSNCHTNIENVFAIGDVANPNAPTIVTAAGMGATAAKAVVALLNRQSKL
jgi:thioredoxin reductase (NADPH)